MWPGLSGSSKPRPHCDNKLSPRPALFGFVVKALLAIYRAGQTQGLLVGFRAGSYMGYWL